MKRCEGGVTPASAFACSPPRVCACHIFSLKCKDKDAGRRRSETRATAEAPKLARVPDRSESGETPAMTSAVGGNH